jgi:hypothetical protein
MRHEEPPTDPCRAMNPRRGVLLSQRFERRDVHHATEALLLVGRLRLAYPAGQGTTAAPVGSGFLTRDLHWA